MLRLLVFLELFHLANSAATTPFFLSPSPTVLAAAPNASRIPTNSTLTVTSVRTSPRATSVKINVVAEHKSEEHVDEVKLVQTSRATRIAPTTTTSASQKTSASPKANVGVVAVKAELQPTVAAPVVVKVTNATVAVENKPVEAHEDPAIVAEQASSTQAPTQKRKWTRAKIVFLVIFGIASALVLVMLITTLVFNWKAPKPQYLHRQVEPMQRSSF